MIEEVGRIARGMIEELGEDALALYDKLPHGKRLRAKLILKIASDTPHAQKFAAIVELIHAASLLHDDVLDDALTRRGVNSINAIFGNKSAIMLGDILYSKGYWELSGFDTTLAQIVSKAVTMLSVGELLDVKYATTFQPDSDLYFDMIYKKTAVLIEASAKGAAYLAHKDESVYALYGKNLGLAFQIVDDILDITQDSETLGKPAMSDFREGKTTLPYIYLYEALDEVEKQKLLQLYQKELTAQEQAWILAKMRETGAIEKAGRLAKQLGEEALDAIASDSDSDLEGIMRSMIERSF